MITMWESKGTKPSARYLPKLAEALGVSVSDLTADAPNQPTTAPEAPFSALVARLEPIIKDTGLSADTLLSGCVDALLAAHSRGEMISLPLEISSRSAQKKGAAVPELPAHMRKGISQRHTA